MCADRRIRLFDLAAFYVHPFVRQQVRRRRVRYTQARALHTLKAIKGETNAGTF